MTDHRSVGRGHMGHYIPKRIAIELLNSLTGSIQTEHSLTGSIVRENKLTGTIRCLNNE